MLSSSSSNSSGMGHDDFNYFDEPTVVEIGILTFNRDIKLGSGRSCEVYEGTYDNRKVAVKVYDGENYGVEKMEKEFLHCCDTHENVIK